MFEKCSDDDIFAVNYDFDQLDNLEWNFVTIEKTLELCDDVKMTIVMQEQYHSNM